MKNSKVIVTAILGMIVLNIFSVAYTPYKTYTYSNGKSAATLSPDAYLPDRILTGESLGIGNFALPNDVFTARDQSVYIADTGNNRIVILDQDYHLKTVIDEFLNNGKTDIFSSPSGVFVTDAGELYVADTDNKRILEFDAAGLLKRDLGTPAINLLPDDYVYAPTAVSVDKSGRIYVVARSVNMGLLQLNADGKFEGFMGAARVAYNPLDYLWRNFMTKEQIDRTKSFVPTEYNNLCIDDSGFIYVTSSAIDEATMTDIITSRPKEPRIAPLKRLNPNGEDILKRNSNIMVAGDISIDYKSKSRSGPSVISDVALGKSATYTILDTNRNRYFTYSKTGDLLFVYGLYGSQTGNTIKPTSITYKGDDFIVADGATGDLTIYKPTAYAATIYKALDLYNNYNYEEASSVWAEMLKTNANSDLAFNNIGKSQLKNEEYQQAMANFLLSRDAVNYSKAFKEYRNQIINRYFLLLVFGLILLAVLVFKTLGKIRKINTDEKYKADRAKLKNQVLYAFHVVFHPFDGFYDLKFEKRGSLKAANVIILLACISLTFRQAFKSFIFNPDSFGSSFSYLTEFSQIVLPVILWVTANWCFTTLMDGEGTFKDIYISTAYALTPLILLVIPATVLSHFMVAEEAAYLNMLISAAFLWTFLLVFLGNLVTGQYTLGKGLVTAGLSILGIGIILFITLIFGITLSQISGFFKNLTTEIMFRL